MTGVQTCALPICGTIAVISSDAALEAYPGWGAYGASKLALDHLLRVWAEEEGRLRFVSFDPEEMDTAMHAAAFPDADRSSLKAPTQAAAELLDLLGAGDVPPALAAGKS